MRLCCRLSILCGTQLPTSGDCLVNGSSVLGSRSASAALLGYCPQQDPLLDKLSGLEQLVMHALLKVRYSCSWAPAAAKLEMLSAVVQLSPFERTRTSVPMPVGCFRLLAAQPPRQV